DADSELAGFAQDRIEAASIGHEVLNLIAVEGKELALLAGKQGILDHREKQASERRCFFAELPLIQIQDDPSATVHRIENRERRMPLADDVTEMRVGGKCRCFIE